MDQALSLLAARLPDGALSTDPDTLRTLGGDSWALRLLRLAGGAESPTPAAAAFPSSTGEVVTVLSWASRTGVPVAVRGGGSGVCGGVDAGPGWVVLDLSRMDRVLEVDPESAAVHVQAGVRGDRLEETLAEHGLSTGHYPQSIALSTVGGWIGASSAGQASCGYGAVEDLLLGLTAVLPGGEVVRLKPVPRSAAGPDLRRLFVGSEGSLGVVTEAWLACVPAPAGFVWDGFGFGSFDDCVAGVRALVRSGAGPTVLRGYDDVDAMLAFGRLGHGGGPVVVAGWESGLPGLAERRRAAAGAVEAGGGAGAGPEYGRHWWEHRNDAVDLYRRIMGEERAFGTGVAVDTMEVAGLWRDLPGLHRAVRGALLQTAEAVGCHLSHVYGSGSSLYFTFMVRGEDDTDGQARYLRAWDAGLRACLDAGGTIAHHHGVGRLKAGHLGEELGPGGAAMLRRIRLALDPDGVLNPGVLDPGPPLRPPDREAPAPDPGRPPGEDGPSRPSSSPGSAGPGRPPR